MFELMMMAIGWLLIGLGFVGCFVNKIPGPLLSFLGVCCCATVLSIPGWAWVVLPALVIASMVVTTKVLPKLTAKLYTFGKGGTWGTTLGALIGISLLGVNIWMGIVLFFLLPYGFAFLFEMKNGKEEGVKRAGAAYVNFICTAMVKLLTFGVSFELLIKA